jgi:hypothetical protein
MYIFLEEHKKFLLLLLKHQVDFMLIGGYAVIYYGYERTTGDMDIWLRPENENREKFILALAEHGIVKADLDVLKSVDFSETRVMYIGAEPNKIDFLTKVQSVEYNNADMNKNYFPLDQVLIPIVHFEHLIQMKSVSNRLKDTVDVDILQKIRKHIK